MTLNRQAIIRHQSATWHCRRPALHQPGISKRLQSFADAAFITKRFSIKCDARLTDVRRCRGRQIEKPQDGNVTLTEDNTLGHAPALSHRSIDLRLEVVRICVADSCYLL